MSAIGVSGVSAAAVQGMGTSAAEEALLNLKTNNQMLERELQHYEERLTKSEAEREQAVSLAVASLEDELSSIIDERDDLTQRIRFLERQLAKAREDRQRAVPVDHAATQTDIEEVVDEDGSDADEDLEEDDLEGTGKSSRRKKRRTKGREKRKAQSGSRGAGEERERTQTSKARLGGFDNLLKSDRVGRIKPKGQICKIISQIYCEKITIDQVDDREGNPRTPLAEFCYDWHLNRYGLRNLAEMNLLDLIASVKHYAKECLKIKLFAQFCNLAGERMHTLEHFNFYLYCMQVISSNVSMLFPDTEDMIYWLKPLRVLDIIRVIYPNLADNSVLRDFMASRVEALMDPKAKMYNADAVLDLLLDEWHRRAERNIAHLKALFRAGDADEDGLLTYDEFLSVVRHADSLRAEREIVRMYRECLLISGDGETVDVESFVSVGRTHGLSNWKIDYNISGVTGKKTPVVTGDDDVSKENLFSMLDSALASAESLEDQIQILKSKLGESHETVLCASKQHTFFQMKYKERDDAEGTWLAYRVLIGEVRAAMVRYKGGLKRIVGLVKSSIAFMNRDRANSSYTSPLQNMLQQSKDEGGVRPSGFGGVAEGEEGGALIPNSTPPIAAGGDSQAVEATTALSMLKGQNEAGATAELPPSET
ncbi:hypothetical protein CYMTET_42280 [Cymbomonas tetramitiformis]|uniref:EF-hand domain-containing protein n=1 Tax=Cymbomonas tetramitiformis TaxID=36881 RepID=A0AAE0F2R9_9CHLO|nr:hypothetical protein CYMTET_42280 [Cymbomonas tetramitiformis]